MARRIYTSEMMAMFLKLAAHGHSASSLAAMLNRAFAVELDADAVRAKAGACGITLRRANDAAVLQVSLSRETERALRTAARERGQPVEKLARDVLAVVASDRLIDAVLDQPVTKAPQPRRNGAPVNALRGG
jgi:hypothetical protein